MDRSIDTHDIQRSFDAGFTRDSTAKRSFYREARKEHEDDERARAPKFELFKQTLKNSLVDFVSFVVKKVFAVDSRVLSGNARASSILPAPGHTVHCQDSYKPSHESLRAFARFAIHLKISQDLYVT